MKKEESLDCDCPRLVVNVCHELNQKSAIVLSYVKLLLNTEAMDALDLTKRREVLLSLEEEANAIRELNNVMYAWLNKNDAWE